MLKNEKLSVVIAAADTYRAGAIEQLREHTNRLNLKIIAQNYGSDPAAVAKDAVLYAKSHKVDCVLIDTAGRMQTCLLYTSPSPRDRTRSRMPSSA